MTSISVGAGYQLGLADIDSDRRCRCYFHSNIHIGISYLFGDFLIRKSN